MKDHPKGLIYFILVNALFMIGLVDINALLTLFVTKRLHFSDAHAYSLFAAFSAIFFSSSIIGGSLGSRYSHRNVLIIGMITALVGLGFISVGEPLHLYLGLGLFIYGAGCAVPNLLCAVGQLYRANSLNRESGYTLVYVGLNIGALLAALSSGYIVRMVSYHGTFFIAAFAMGLGVLCLMLALKRAEFQPDSHISQQLRKSNANHHGILPTLLVGLITVPAVTWLLEHSRLSNQLLMLSSIVGAAIVMWLAFRLPEKQRDRLLAFLFLIVVAVCFWSLYMLAPSVLTLFIERNVCRHIAGFIIPTSSFYALNPFFIILIGSLLSRYWIRRSQAEQKFNLARVFSVGIFLMGGGYLLLAFAVSHAHNQLGYISMVWIILSYLLQSSGELLIGPVGNAMVGTLVPPHLEGVMMGFFQLFMGVAGAVSNIMAQSTKTVAFVAPLKTNPVFIHSFTLFGGAAIGVAALVMVLSPWFTSMTEQD